MLWLNYSQWSCWSTNWCAVGTRHGGLCHQWGPCSELATCPGSTLPTARDSWNWLQQKSLQPHKRDEAVTDDGLMDISSCSPTSFLSYSRLKSWRVTDDQMNVTITLWKLVDFSGLNIIGNIWDNVRTIPSSSSQQSTLQNINTQQWRSPPDHCCSKADKSTV